MKSILAFVFLLLVPRDANAGDDSLYVTFSGDTVKVWNTGIRANCAAKFAFSIVYLDSHDIVITECDTIPNKAKCMCTFDLSVSLLLPLSGPHNVSVYRQFLKQYGYSNDTTEYVGSISFYPPGKTFPSLAANVFQGPCYSTVVAVQSREKDMEGYLFSAAYPNPSNPSIAIHFTLPVEGRVTIQLFDAIGRVVATLLDEERPRGAYSLTIDSSLFPSSGTYFLRMIAGVFNSTRKISVVR